MKVKLTKLSSSYRDNISINDFIAELEEVKQLFSNIPTVSMELNYDNCYYEGDSPSVDVFVEGDPL